MPEGRTFGVCARVVVAIAHLHGRTGGGEDFAPTSAQSTLTVELPAGLTALSMSGNGWTCDLASTTCTTDSGAAIAAGGQSAVTLQVAVASNAPVDAVTLVEVSGGGDIDAWNNAYFDATFIS